MSIERDVAQRLAHHDRINTILAETGGEAIHPDHYAIREAMRLAVLAAFDSVSADRGICRMSDGELPALFKTVDAIAERVFLKSAGL